jgi:hypothetical protein
VGAGATLAGEFEIEHGGTERAGRPDRCGHGCGEDRAAAQRGEVSGPETGGEHGVVDLMAAPIVTARDAE